MKEDIIKNPFIDCTARDMDSEDIRKFWCSPFELYRMNEDQFCSSRTPIILEGARGTGKTMILKYFSYSVQKEYVAGKKLIDKLSYLKEHGFGIYFRYKADFCNMLSYLDCTLPQKERLFEKYFCLFIIREIVKNIKDVYFECDSCEMLTILNDFFEVDGISFECIVDSINFKIKELDNKINNSIYDKNWIDKIDELNQGDLLKQLINEISQIKLWEGIQFNILIDEYENAKDYQRVINTWLKQVDEENSISYRIGMRPEGLANNATYVGDECLQVDRDYILQPLVFSSFKEYSDFALKVATRRLESVEECKRAGLTDIVKILGKREDIDWEAKTLVKDNRQFRIIRDCCAGEQEYRSMIETLSSEEKLMEMYNILRVARGGDYRKIGETCREYCELRKNRELKKATGAVYKYKMDYSSKYRMSLLYALITIYKKEKLYYSTNTFLRLSSGAINDFISLCRNTFQYIGKKELSELKKGKVISPQIQTLAAERTAKDQYRKIATSNKHGKEVAAFVENIGVLFGYYHQDLKIRYPETNQFAFGNEMIVRQDAELNDYLVELINTGAIVCPEKKHHITLGKQKGNVYQLNRIFAPIYTFSYRTRGGVNVILTKEIFRKMLLETVDPKKMLSETMDVKKILVKKKEQEKIRKEDDNQGQYSLKDYLGDW